MHKSDHDVAGAERTMSKHGASFCSTFVHLFGQYKNANGYRGRLEMCYGYLMQISEDNDKPTDTAPSGDFDEFGHLVKPEKKGPPEGDP